MKKIIKKIKDMIIGYKLQKAFAVRQDKNHVCYFQGENEI